MKYNQFSDSNINYFGYSADSSLWGILIVFRNADGTLTGKNDANGDIWIDMSANPPVSAFSGVSTYFSPNLYNSITWSNGATSQNLAVSVSGDYSITVTDINGCSDSDTISVGLHGLPIVNIGNTAFLRYSGIFLRKNGSKELDIPISIITDVDIREYEKNVKTDGDGKVVKNVKDKAEHIYTKRNPTID